MSNWVPPLCQKHSYEELCFHHPRSQAGVNRIVTGHSVAFMGVVGHFFSGLELACGQAPSDKQRRSRAHCSRGGGLTGNECMCLFTGTVCDDFLHMWRLIVHCMNHSGKLCEHKYLGRCLTFLSRLFTSLSTKNGL